MQIKSVLITLVWSGVVAVVAYKIADLLVGLRVSEKPSAKAWTSPPTAKPPTRGSGPALRRCLVAPVHGPGTPICPPIRAGFFCKNLASSAVPSSANSYQNIAITALSCQALRAEIAHRPVQKIHAPARARCHAQADPGAYHSRPWTRPCTLIDQVRAAHARQAPLRIGGGGGKQGIFTALPLGELLDTRPYHGIVSHEPTELVVTVRAGTPLAELEAVLAEQPVPALRAPAFASGATVGGMVAAGLAGPARASAGGCATTCWACA